MDGLSETTIVNNEGHTVVHERDADFRLTRDVDGAGNATQYGYNAAGLRDAVTDALGHSYYTGYDARGNAISAIDPDGHTTRASYDASNNVEWTQDALGRRTDLTYDAAGINVTRVASPAGAVDYDHYANGLVHHATNAGATTTFGYDPAGRLTSLIDPLGFESAFEYSAAGYLTASVDAEGRRVESDYDAEGHLTRVEDELGNAATFTYDANGNRTSATDARGKTTDFTYDVMDQLVGVTDALGRDTAYTHDRNYNLASVTNARGKRTDYTYAPNDQLTRVEDATGRVWSLDYDATGNLTRTTYPDAHTVDRSYDECGLLASMSATSGVGYTYDYDASHALTSVENAEGTRWTYGYDAAGRVKTSADDLGSSTFTSTRTYNPAGQLSALAATGLPTRGAAYDLAGRLTTLTLDAATPATAAAFAYDRAGLPTSRITPDGTVTGITYDAAGRLASIAATGTFGVLARTYERDANGRITSENAERFSYDALGRLTGWYDPSQDATTTYTFDEAYNLTGTSVDGSVTAEFTFDAADRISSSGYAYDANGNLIGRPGERLAYDALNHLTTVIDVSTEATLAAYTYDHLNRRVSSTTPSGTVFFHYDGASPDVIAETDESGDVIASYVRDASGRLVAMERGGERYYYHANARGDVLALTDESGTIANEYRYDPYGRILAADETVANPYRYAGYRYDGESGLYNLWNRYYDPATMRFITKDLYPGELSAPGTMNGYAYCLGDPVNGVDPSGLWTMGVNATYQGGLFGMLAGSGSIGYALEGKAAMRQFVAGPFSADQGVKVPVFASGNATFVGMDAIKPIPNPNSNGTLNTGYVLPFGRGGSIQAQFTTADSPCDLRGHSKRYGFDLNFVSVDLILADKYWGLELGPGTPNFMPNFHRFDEYTTMLTPDALEAAGLR